MHGKPGMRARILPPMCYIFDGLAKRTVSGKLHTKSHGTQQISDNTFRRQRITERERRTNDEVVAGGICAQQRQIGGQIKMEWCRAPGSRRDRERVEREQARFRVVKCKRSPPLRARGHARWRQVECQLGTGEILSPKAFECFALGGQTDSLVSGEIGEVVGTGCAWRVGVRVSRRSDRRVGSPLKQRPG